jgi:hypothetical protein
MMTIDVNNMLPYQAEEFLKRLSAIKGPYTADEAAELHSLEKRLRAKAASSYEPDA